MTCCGQRMSAQRAAPRATGTEHGTAARKRTLRKRLPRIFPVHRQDRTDGGRRDRNRYRFTHGGAIVAVDARDRRSMSAVPALRQVVGP